MISTIRQVSSGAKISFDITNGENVIYKATQPSLNIRLPFELENSSALIMEKYDGTPIFTTKYSVIDNIVEEFVPFKFLITGGQRFNKFEVISNENHVGAIYKQTEKMMECNKYHIEYQGKVFFVKEISIGMSNVLAIFLDERQIAQITKPLVTTANLDEYFLHLIDEQYFEILAFFAIYYDYQEYRNAGEAILGKAKKSYSIEYSIKKPEYDVDFIAKNFGVNEANALSKHISDAYGWWTPKRIMGVACSLIIGIFTVLGSVFIFIHLSA